jgi:hypothetical protein
MNLKLTENYLLQIDDSPIKIGDYHTCTYPEYPIETRCVTDPEVLHDTCKGCKRIVAHLPLNDAPKLKGVDLIKLTIVTSW